MTNTQNNDLLAIHGPPVKSNIKGTIYKSGKTRVTWFISDKGTVYALGRSAGTVTHYDRRELALYFEAGDLDALRKLGVITRDEMKSMKQYEKDHNASRSRRDAIASMEKAAKKLGLNGRITKILKGCKSRI